MWSLSFLFHFYGIQVVIWQWYLEHQGKNPIPNICRCALIVHQGTTSTLRKVVFNFATWFTFVGFFIGFFWACAQPWAYCGILDFQEHVEVVLHSYSQKHVVAYPFLRTFRFVYCLPQLLAFAPRGNDKFCSDSLDVQFWEVSPDLSYLLTNSCTYPIPVGIPPSNFSCCLQIDV